VAQCGYFEQSRLEALVRQHASNRHDHSTTLWKLLMLDAFLRQTQAPSAPRTEVASNHRAALAGVAP
jgi:asparagine synthase (glutamine-hydrolysing)